MSNQSYMPQAKSDVHITPERVWQIIKQRWYYSKHDFFDPCPLNPNFDGLTISWKKLNFVNPPYSKLRQFVYKAISEKQFNHTSILLLPAKTDQQWFHDILDLPFHDILWIKKRLKFQNNRHHATQPHFLVKI